MRKLVCVLLTAALLAAPVAGYEAKSWVLMDAATGTVLDSENEHEPLAPASVTKVMTLLLIMEAIDSGQIAWDDTVTASESAAAKGGSQVFLKVGETMSVEDMVKSIAVSSANDCACAMAEHLAGSEAAFVERMNEKAQALGMDNTNFVNCTGLDDDDAAKAHRTSAHDIAIMSRELLTKHPDIKRYTTIWMDSIRGGSFGLSNTNKLVRFYPGCTGLKTGFTSGAGYCLSASAERDGMELIAVCMGAETSQKRNDACRGLLDYGFANYAHVTPVLPEGAAVAVKLGTAESVPAVLADEGPLLVAKGDLNKISIRTVLPEQIDAPVELGQQLGELTVEREGETVAVLPILAAEAVEKLGWPELFVRLLGRVAMGS
ncbi:MAG: D-alanyl-D-alanine carboxypeptidase [Oscillospiraceae bacterium]|nr:D-alanyl-D-alanine carboxypeptidase [Oscillospiraceae bacterium]